MTTGVINVGGQRVGVQVIPPNLARGSGIGHGVGLSGGAYSACQSASVKEKVSLASFITNS